MPRGQKATISLMFSGIIERGMKWMGTAMQYSDHLKISFGCKISKTTPVR